MNKIIEIKMYIKLRTHQSFLLMLSALLMYEFEQHISIKF